MKTASSAARDMAWTTDEGEPMVRENPRQECLRLLATARIGRIAFTDQALPAVEPVNFCLDRDTVVFRVGSASRLATALRNSVVAFQVDHIDEHCHGWSVTAIGQAEIVAEPDETAWLSQLPLHRPTHDAATFVRLPLTMIKTHTW